MPLLAHPTSLPHELLESAVPASLPGIAERPEVRAGTEPPFVLIVDDDREIRRCFANVLRPKGFSVCMADCAARALELADRRRPDAVLVDLMLPDMTGLELVHAWRTDPGHRMQRVPVLVLTGRQEPEDCAAAEALGVSDFLIKPVDRTVLVNSVRSAVSKNPFQGFRSLLTGLPGVAAMNEEIRRRVQEGAEWGVLQFDIKGMGDRNRKCGYRSGDHVIRLLAAAICSSGRRRVFHTGGDVLVEFVEPQRLHEEAFEVIRGFEDCQRDFDARAAGSAGMIPEWSGSLLDADTQTQPGALRLAAAGLTVPAGRIDLTPRRVHAMLDALIADAKRRPGNVLIVRTAD